MTDRNFGFATKAVHAGEKRNVENRPLTTPIYQTATYTFENTQALKDFFEGKTQRIAEYGRYGNPTTEVAQEKLKVLEGAEACLLFSSGMNAITTAIIAMCKQGDKVLLTSDSYRRTRQFMRQVISKFGIDFELVDPNIATIEAAIDERTKLIISESPTNPYLRVLDLQSLAEVCKKYHVKSMVDATFATPLNQRPLEYGIDLVTHSITKYLSGHNDLLAGALMGSEALISAIKELQAILGGVIDPHACYLIIRGLKTFPLRIERQNQSAMQIAHFLENHPKIERVWYPGLESHPDYNIASKQMSGFGAVISFQIKGNLDDGSRFIDALEIAQIAPSLGGVESLIEQPSLMSYFDLTTQERENIGIYDNLIRLSVGVEDTQDLIDDFKRALG